MPKLNAAGVGVPVAKGGSYRGSAAAIKREYRKDGGTVRVAGHQYIDSISFAAAGRAAPGLGERCDHGQYPINPTALGGPLAIFASTYEQHRVHAMRFLYCPSVAAIEQGALAMYFRNDVSTPSDEIGTEELAHAATHRAFAQMQVWERMTLEISPSDATSKYFDTDVGDARLRVQGLLTVLAASPLSAKAYGNLFVEYDIEFFAEELDYEVHDVASGTFELATDGFSSTAANPVVILLQPTSPGTLSGIFDAGDPESAKVILSMCVIASAGVSLNYISAASDVVSTFVPGQGFFGRIFPVPGDDWNGGTDFTDGTLALVLYSDYNSAASAASIADLQPGQLLWPNNGPVADTEIRFTWRAEPLSYDDG